MGQHTGPMAARQKKKKPVQGSPLWGTSGQRMTYKYTVHTIWGVQIPTASTLYVPALQQALPGFFAGVWWVGKYGKGISSIDIWEPARVQAHATVVCRVAAFSFS